MKLGEVAARIAAHLHRFEKDPEINAPRMSHEGMVLYYLARAYAAGPYVMVTYASYQGPRSLTKAEALAYLAWLDNGNIGTHHKQQQEYRATLLGATSKKE